MILSVLPFSFIAFFHLIRINLIGMSKFSAHEETPTAQTKAKVNEAGNPKGEIQHNGKPAESKSPKSGSTPSSHADAVTASPISSSPISSSQGSPTTNDGKVSPLPPVAKTDDPPGPMEGIDGIVGGSGSESDSQDQYQPIDLIRVMVPVTLCILFVIVMTVIITPPGKVPHRPWMALTPFNTPGAGVAKKTWETMGNVGILIGVIVLVTFAMVGLYMCYCYKLLIVIMAIPVVVVNLVFSWIYLHKVIQAMNVPFDHITAGILAWNFGAIGILSILGYTPKRLQQFYLLYLCGVMAILYVQFMPDWTVWLFLGALAVWDLIAVLTPCGPLRMLVETIQEREHDFAPAMVYTTMIYTMAGEDSNEGSKKEDHGSGKKPEKKEKRRLRLGLGDFVFYSLLTGKATEQCLVSMSSVDWNIIMACFIAVIAGLLATIVLLVLYNKALPALPVSIALGLAFYFSTTYIISPFCSMMSSQQIFI